MGTPTKLADQLARYHELETQRKDLERQARLLQSEERLIGQQIEEALTASGTDKIRRGNYEARWIDGRVNVAWKDEFLRRLGAAAAAEVQAAAAKLPPPKKLHVERLAAA